MSPGDARGSELLAVFYWEKVFRDRKLTAAQRNDFIAKGIEASDQALELDADRGDALACKSLLLRMQANGEPDLETRRQLLDQADSLHTRAQELAKKKTSGL
jgi:hypothetical protein